MVEFIGQIIVMFAVQKPGDEPRVGNPLAREEDRLDRIACGSQSMQHVVVEKLDLPDEDHHRWDDEKRPATKAVGVI